MSTTGIHPQQVRTGTPSTIDGTSAASAEGSAGTLARADHTHATLYGVGVTFKQKFDSVDAAITSEASTRATADTAEATARAAADTAEATARAAADTAEATARAAADTALSSSITSEASTRATADTTEATARAAADTTLQNNINTNTTSITSLGTRVTTLEGLVKTAICTTATAGSFGGSAFTIVNYGTVVRDDFSGVTTGASWKFTVPAGQAGLYLFSASVNSVVTGGAVLINILSAFLNGTEFQRGNRVQVAGSQTNGLIVTGVVPLIVGDYLDVRLWANGGMTLETSAFDNRICITRIA
jgi:hypothetical protein